MSPKATSYLLNNGSLHVMPPALHLNGHPSPYHFANDKSTAHIDTPVIA